MRCFQNKIRFWTVQSLTKKEMIGMKREWKVAALIKKRAK